MNREDAKSQRRKKILKHQAHQDHQEKTKTVIPAPVGVSRQNKKAGIQTCSLGDKKMNFNEIMNKFKEKESSREEKFRKKTLKNELSGFARYSCAGKPNEKAILVYGEGGVGDEIFCFQFLETLAKENKSVVYGCDAKLLGLFTANCPDNVKIIDRRYAEKFKKDYKVMFSWQLIGWYGKEEKSWEDTKYPYLGVPEKLVSELKGKYKTENKQIVGIAWESETKAKKNVDDKSCPLDKTKIWKPVFSREDCSYISLQYGDTKIDVANALAKYSIAIYQDKDIDIYDDLISAAAQIEACDIVVTISTTAAHLARALSKKTILLLPKEHYVHWDFPSNDKTFKKLIQKEAGVWDQDISSALKSFSN